MDFEKWSLQTEIQVTFKNDLKPISLFNPLIKRFKYYCKKKNTGTSRVVNTPILDVKQKYGYTISEQINVY